MDVTFALRVLFFEISVPKKNHKFDYFTVTLKENLFLKNLEANSVTALVSLNKNVTGLIIQRNTGVNLYIYRIPILNKNNKK